VSRFLFRQSARYLAICGACFLLAPGTASSAPLDAMLDAEGAFWSLTHDTFLAAWKDKGFRWTSSAKETARAYKTLHTFMEQPVMEALVRFGENEPQSVDFVLYNRGDSGVVSEAVFEKAVKDIQAKLSEWSGKRPRKLEDRGHAGGVNRRRYLWTRGAHQVALEYSYSTGQRAQGRRYLPEYIRARCVASDGVSDMGSRVKEKMMRRARALSALELKKKVKREENGDIHIGGIPMVDQGQKGYCAVATAERVLRYYGRDVDANQLAQLAMTSAEGGTNPDNMLSSLRSAGMKLGCKVRAKQSFSLSSFNRMVRAYNRKARKAGKPRIVLGQRIDIGQVYSSMDLDLLREVRARQGADFKNFMRDVRSHVGRGLPLCWSVLVGRVKEKPPVQGTGGHMRLIIGYNDKTSELLYSDSWGRGHESKRMALPDAWTITLGLYAIEPGRLR